MKLTGIIPSDFCGSLSADSIAWGDYHTHTPLCLHADGAPAEYVAAALAAGLSQYGVADHAPMFYEPYDDWRMSQSEIPAYLDWIDEARQCAQGTGLEVLAGLECDWMLGIESWIEHLHTLHAWDYLIGSVHYLDDHWAFDSPHSISLWSQIDVEDAWSCYWKRYAEMAGSGLFQIMGHADLIRKFGHRPIGDLKHYYMPAIEAMVRTGAILEINTAGWHKPCAEQYPSVEFIQLARQANIPLVISSDAHAPHEVARDFQKARNLISSIC